MPPFSYYGGKTTLAPQIAALLPEHDHYVEPFAGSLAVLLAKDASMAETVNDLDGDLTAFWRVLRDRPAELERAAMLTPHSRVEYATALDLDVDDELEHARRVWVMLTQGRAHSMKASGWKFGVNATGRLHAPYLKTFAGRMEAAAARLAHVTIENRDALEVIRDYGQEPSVCIYADPPYLGSTRATNYRVEMTADDDHTVLAEALKACKASVVLSGYDSPLYADLFMGWHRADMKAPTTLAGKNDGPREVLWSNVPLGVQGALDLEGLGA